MFASARPVTPPPAPGTAAAQWYAETNPSVEPIVVKVTPNAPPAPAVPAQEPGTLRPVPRSGPPQPPAG